jgi:hypothetical protein
MDQGNADYAELDPERRSLPSLRSLAVGGVVVAVILAGIRYAINRLPVDRGYTFMADFATVPPDDAELKTWLRAQPGVWGPAVSRTKVGRLTHIQVDFGLSHEFGDAPPFPNLSVRCAELGYQGQATPWQFVP